MFRPGEHIIYGLNGICRVEQVGKSPYDETDPRTYYLLIPLSGSASSILTPVDNDRVPMRRLMTRNEIETLIDDMPTIEPLTVPVEKKRREVYHDTVRALDPRGYVQVIKTVRQRRAELSAAHKHFPVTDLEYGQLARHLLCSECAHVLGLDEKSAENYINSRLPTVE